MACAPAETSDADEAVPEPCHEPHHDGWPAEPDLAERCNLEEVEDAATAPLAGVIPAGIGKDPEAVQQTARNLGGI